MENKRIRFDDRFYLTIFSFIVSCACLTTALLFVEDIPIWILIFLLVLFTLFLSGVFVFPNVGISINYKREIIKYFGWVKITKSEIKFDEIETISFEEISKERKKVYLDFSRTAAGHGGIFNEPQYVYANGKIFEFVIILKDGSKIVMPYYSLFKAISKKRVAKQEKYIINAIKELNEYLMTSRH